jgi:hypothetical protein
MQTRLQTKTRTAANPVRPASAESAATISVVPDISAVTPSTVRTLDVLEVDECGLVLGKGRAAAGHVVSEACFRFRSAPLFRYRMEVA